MEIPDFIQTNLPGIVASMVARYEQLYFEATGEQKQIQPAQAEMLMIETFGYEVYLQALRVQNACLMMLVPFATGIVLDMIAKPYGVVRLPEQPAVVRCLLTLIAGHGDLVIPENTRIQSQDGLATFYLAEPVAVAAGVLAVEVGLVCDTPGTAGNGYQAGTISEILDPQAYLVSSANIDQTAGGAEIESDASVRGRIYLASDSFSVAGSDGAYIYFAKSASSAILDVKPKDNGNGGVHLYVLIEGGTTPVEILNAVEAACSPKIVRPLTDSVTALSSVAVHYSVDYDIIAYSSVADSAALVLQSKAAVQALVDANGRRLGVDTTMSQLYAAAKVDGVYDIIFHSPLVKVAVDETQVAICDGVTATLTGFNDDK